MEKEFIPYEQALALKEFGFDVPCLSYYISTSYYNSKKEKKYRKAILYHGHFSKNTLSEFDDNSSIQVITPLYQQVFRWFREKYSLFTQDFIDLDNKFTKNIVKVTENGQDFIYLNYHKTYEEAELECLKKLIEIVKQK